MRKKLGCIFSSFVALALCSSPSLEVSAQSSAAASQHLFQEGAALLKAGKVHDACVKFEESEKLDPQLGTLLNLASCHEKEGRTATSWAEYTELIALAGKRGDQKRVAYAKGKAAELEKQLARMQLDVPAGTGELALDGVALGQAAWGVPLPIDPGEHVITYAASGKKPGTKRITATAAQTIKVALPVLEEQPSATPPPTPDTTPRTQPPPAPTPEPLPSAHAAPSTPPAEPKAERSTMRTVGYGVAAVGVVGVGLGSVFGAMALGAKSDVSAGCNGSQCTKAGLDAVDTARTDGTISTVSFIAGGVCLAAGITMVVLGGKKTAQTGIAPMMGPNGGGLAAFGTF
jgi:hypothetical protein